MRLKLFFGYKVTHYDFNLKINIVNFEYVQKHTEKFCHIKNYALLCSERHNIITLGQNKANTFCTRYWETL